MLIQTRFAGTFTVMNTNLYYYYSSHFAQLNAGVRTGISTSRKYMRFLNNGCTRVITKTSVPNSQVIKHIPKFARSPNREILSYPSRILSFLSMIHNIVYQSTTSERARTLSVSDSSQRAFVHSGGSSMRPNVFFFFFLAGRSLLLSLSHPIIITSGTMHPAADSRVAYGIQLLVYRGSVRQRSRIYYKA